MKSIRVALLFLMILIPSPAMSQENLVEGFQIAKDPKKTVFSREGNGIRIKAPAGNLMNLLVRNNNLWISDSDFALSGNFDVQVDFDVNQIGPKEGKAATEANAEISIQGVGRFSVYGININTDANGMTFKVVRFEPGERGTHYNLLSFPRKSNKGKIGIRREGSEILFLATETPGEELKELVRLPYDSTLIPKVRISAYQGNGAILMPVDVLFSNFAVKAEKVLKGKEANQAPVEVPIPESYPVNLEYAKNPTRILTDLKQTNDSRQTFKLEGEAVRIKPPVLANSTGGDYPGYWFHDSVYTLRGNFEISVAFDVNQLAPAPSGGYGSVSFGIGLETDGPMGSISFGRGASRGDGQRFSITRYSPTSAGRHWDTQSFKTTAMKGRLMFRKTGDQLHFLVQEGDNPPRELFQCPGISSTPVKFRIHADQGGTNSAVIDVGVSDLVVKGDDITENGKPVKAIKGASSIPGPDSHSEPEEPPPSRKWLYVILSLGVLSALAVALFLTMRGSNKGPVKSQAGSPGSNFSGPNSSSSNPAPGKPSSSPVSPAKSPSPVPPKPVAGPSGNAPQTKPVAPPKNPPSGKSEK